MLSFHPFTHLHCWSCAPSPTPTHSSPKPQGSLLLMIEDCWLFPNLQSLLLHSLRSLAGDVATQNKDRMSQARLYRRWVKEQIIHEQVCASHGSSSKREGHALSSPFLRLRCGEGVSCLHWMDVHREGRTQGGVGASASPTAWSCHPVSVTGQPWMLALRPVREKQLLSSLSFLKWGFLL